MTDFLIQAHKAPSHRVTKPKVALTDTKVEVRPTKLGSEHSLRIAISNTLRDANDAILSWKDGLTVQERDLVRTRAERKSLLFARMKKAESYAQWKSNASELDTLDGNDDWKHDYTTGDYDFRLIQRRLRALEEARLNCDIRAMMHLIRTELSRDLGGMDNVDLYRHSYVGTKKLIEHYVDSAIQTIEALVTQSALKHHGVEVKDLLEGMLYSRQSFGRSALLLSGGGTFGMTHIGVLKALFDQKLLPRIISGASAGSIVCAVMCTKTDEEIPSLFEEFPYGDLAVFEEEDCQLGILGHLRRLLTEGSWSNIENLTRVLRGMMGDMTFQEAYNRSRRILNICVSTASIYELPRLLNYITAPNVMIWSAVAASCSLPLVYTSSPLLVKNPVTGDHLPWTPSPQHFIDGSVDNDLPMTRLSEMFNVNHFIVCQVNPHVVPFLSKDDILPSDNKFPEVNASSRTDDVDWACTLSSLARDEALHRLQFMAELGVFPNLMTKCRAILSQKYSGDITILPEIAMNDFPKILSNPTVDFMLRSSIIGARATWPRMSRIRDRCAIELALDHAVHSLRTRVVFSESQRNLRALSTSIGSLRDSVSHHIVAQGPLAVAGHSAAGIGQVRSRRRSSGSVKHLADGRIVLDVGLTDEDSAAEERHELLSRGHTNTFATNAHRKPRLKRSSKSVINVPLQKEFSSPITSRLFGEALDFDFSQPVTTDAGKSKLTPSQPANTADDKPTKPRTWPVSLSSLGRAEPLSPTDDLETSELGHSSDADAELATEESDPDLCDVSPCHAPTRKSRKADHGDIEADEAGKEQTGHQTQ